MTFTELLNYLYRDPTQGAKYGVPTFHMFNLATNYIPAYDLSTNYTTDPDMFAQGYNTNFILDEELDRLAQEMVKVDPEDRETFKQKFVEFTVRWNYLLPDLPLYSNIYHDFYNDKLKDYEINALVRISQAILYAYVTE
jgi:peptide/nickel transport system substrate-binding protein